MVTLAQDEPALGPAARAFRTILTHVSPDPAEAPRLHAAVSLARKFDATLFGVACETVPPLTASDPTGLAGSQWMVAMQEVTRANLERAHQLFFAEAQGLRSDWTAVEAFPTEALVRLSAAADLIVAGGQMSRRIERHRSVDAGELMLRSGRPVLVVPPTGGELSARAVVVAWKGTREGRRALADAMPFLQAAEDVLVVDVCHEAETSDAEARTAAVVRNLARHGAPARAKVVVAPSHRVATELNIAAEGVDADLIVAGGYGHSRLGEWVFGGVTYDLLHAQERFLFLSH